MWTSERVKTVLQSDQDKRTSDPAILKVTTAKVETNIADQRKAAYSSQHNAVSNVSIEHGWASQNTNSTTWSGPRRKHQQDQQSPSNYTLARSTQTLLAQKVCGTFWWQHQSPETMEQGMSNTMMWVWRSNPSSTPSNAIISNLDYRRQLQLNISGSSKHGYVQASNSAWNTGSEDAKGRSWTRTEKKRTLICQTIRGQATLAEIHKTWNLQHNNTWRENYSSVQQQISRSWNIS